MENINSTKYLVDTNAIFKQPELLEKYNVVIPSHVLREVEHLELTRKQDKQLQYEIRRFKQALDQNEHLHVDLNDYTFNLREDWDGQYTDNILVQICVEEGYGMLTNDRLLKDKCRLYNIEVVNLDAKEEYVEFKGFKEVNITEKIHENIMNASEYSNPYDLMVNEYGIINNSIDGELIDIVKWDGEKLLSLRNEKGKLGHEFTTFQFGHFQPKDEYQIMAVDSILNNQLTSLRGKAGSGKSIIALNTAWHLVESEGYKLVIFVNPAEAKNSASMGYYKGDKLSKILQNVGTLVTKFGDEFIIQDLIAANKLDIQPFANLRGYDTGENKVICWIVEAQNLTSELLKLGLQRLGSNTKVVVDGDFHLQIDMDAYEKENGMKRMSEVFRGNELYGEIELQNVWRSRLAEIAESM